jgi:hypothetical protein
MKHAGNFETPAGDYGARFELPDGTLVNVVTVIVGAGIGAELQLEAPRPLTDKEIDAVLEADDLVEHFDDPKTDYMPMVFQRRF